MEINFINKTNDDVNLAINLIQDIFNSDEYDYSMSVIFVTSDEIHQINKQYRNVDRVTDVISFAIMDNDDNYTDKEIGDIFICLDKAYLQATEYGHSKEREIGFLTVHGFLHLLGYDHMNPNDEKIMMSKAEEILTKANLGR